MRSTTYAPKEESTINFTNKYEKITLSQNREDLQCKSHNLQHYYLSKADVTSTGPKKML